MQNTKDIKSSTIIKQHFDKFDNFYTFDLNQDKVILKQHEKVYRKINQVENSKQDNSNQQSKSIQTQNLHMNSFWKSTNAQLFKYSLISLSFIINQIFQDMQNPSEMKKQELWNKLKTQFQPYATKDDQMPTEKLEDFVRRILRETTVQEIEYCLKNMYRVDAEGSGKINIFEMGNFLFKRHCGEMCLQKAHMEKMITKCKQRMINCSEFHTLLNNAFKFLHVPVDEGTCSDIFKKADKDNDKQITYCQYFQIMKDIFCESLPTKPSMPKKSWKSNFRHFLKCQLRRVYDRYIVENRIQELIGPLSPSGYAMISHSLSQVRDKVDCFEPFSCSFLRSMARKGLSKFHSYQPSNKRTLNYSEFQAIMRRTYAFLHIHRMREQFMKKLFETIDKNKDGMITYKEYLVWVSRYLSCEEIEEDEYYLKEDDSAFRTIHLKPMSEDYIFRFDSYDFSKQVHMKIWNMMTPYNKNKSKTIDEKEMREILISMLKSNQNQLQHANKTMRRMDKNHDNRVTFEEFANYCCQQHFGQIAVHRQHKMKKYSRYEWRMMKYEEFHSTLASGLSCIGMELPKNMSERFFHTLDVDNCGWIMFDTYYYFLTDYFGSLKPNEQEEQKWYKSLLPLSPIERFNRLYIDQLKRTLKPFDHKSNFCELEQILFMLKTFFGFDRSQIRTISYNIYSYKEIPNLEILIRTILQSYLVICGWLEKHRDPSIETWSNIKVTLEEFIECLMTKSHFLKRVPSKQDLTEVFKSIGSKKDGTITLRELVDFIAKNIGVNLFPIQKYPEMTDQLSEYIMTDIETIFKKYSKDNTRCMTKKEIELFMREFLETCSELQCSNIFKTFSCMCGQSNDAKISFDQFVPCALFYAGQKSLRNFHISQASSKRTLTLQDLNKVIRNAFKFLRSFEKCDLAMKTLYERLGHGSEPTYQCYFNWLREDLPRKYKCMSIK